MAQKRKLDYYDDDFDFDTESLSRIELAERIVEKYHTHRHLKLKPTEIVSNTLRLSARHFLDYIPATEKKKEPTRRCVLETSHSKQFSNYRRAHFITSRNGRSLYPALLTAGNSKKTSHCKQLQNTGGHTSSLAGTGDTCIQHFSQLGTPGISSHSTCLITIALLQLAFFLFP
ncbi:piggyBac transposable element-derived protein 4 [Trichonephila clavipes]|nr:piggyBac transposable element-derived protein 4 [Trichonephila clavipes]